MEITLGRSLEIAPHIEGIVEHLNAITEEDLKALLKMGSRKEALDPLIDPSGWRDVYGEADRQGMKVFRAMLDFKRTVKGIGNFT